MARLKRKLVAGDIAVGDTVTVNYQDTEQQMVVEDVHMGEICGTVTDVDGNDSYQCFTRPEISNVQKGLNSIDNVDNPEGGEEPAADSGADNPFQKFMNKQVKYNVLMPGPDGVSKVYPEGTIIKTGYDGVGYYGVLRTDKGKEYTIREEDINELQEK